MSVNSVFLPVYSVMLHVMYMYLFVNTLTVLACALSVLCFICAERKIHYRQIVCKIILLSRRGEV